MAKFIKFNIQNSGNGLDAVSGIRYVNVDDIESVYDGLVANVPDTVTIVLKGSNASGVQATYTGSGDANNAVPATTSEISGRVLVLQVRNSASLGFGAAGAVADVTVAENMPSMAVRKAMSANPGGTVATAQLARDGAGTLADAQMYWNSFQITNTSPVPTSS